MNRIRQQPELSSLVLGLVAAAAVVVLASAPAALAEGAFFDKQVDVPRAERVPVEISFERATLTFVESQNDPREKDVKDAADKDPDDKTWVLLRFHYRNDGYVKHRVKLRVVLVGEKGEAYAEEGRSSTLDAQQKDDTISFPIRVKTLDWPKAKALKIFATFLE